jgi:hypothetical protein
MRSVAALLLCSALGACATLGTKPAPPAPAAPGSFIILFQGHVTEVNARAAAVLNSVAAKANQNPDQVVQVAGPPVARSFGYDPRLARQRIQEVEHELEAAGVDRERIVRILLPRGNLRADGTGPQQIEIRLVSRPAKPPKPPKQGKARTA